MRGVEGVTRVTLWSPCRRSTTRTSFYSQLTWAITGILSVGIRRSLFKLRKAVRKRFDLARTRTWNPLIRSQMPYPLGHKAVIKVLRLNRHTMCNKDYHQKILKEILVANSSN